MKLTTQERREQLTREQEEIYERCRQANVKAQQRLDAISAELRRLKLAEMRLTLTGLVGKPGAVRVRYNDRQLNGLAGTVLAVKRTRALVNFGLAAGKWDMLLGDLVSTATQGELLNLGDGTP